MIQIIPIKTKALRPPKDDLFSELDKLPKLKSGDVLCIASKVLAIHQGRTVIIKGHDKDQLTFKEADYYIPRSQVPGQHAIPTIKSGTMILSSGIDESNGNGYYVLWPENVQKLMMQIHQKLTIKHKITKLGIIATDSRTAPLRYGTTGAAVGFFGFRPLLQYIGKKDIFGRPFHLQKVNLPDSLASSAVLAMGEGAERTPLAIIRGFKNLQFTRSNQTKNWLVPMKQDMYYPLLKVYTKKKKI